MKKEWGGCVMGKWVLYLKSRGGGGKGNYFDGNQGLQKGEFFSLIIGRCKHL